MTAPAPTPEPVATPTDADLAREMAATLIRQFEGCTLPPTPDTPPHWQIGYGCNYLADGSAVRSTTPPLPNIDAAEALLQALLGPLADKVDALLTVPATVGQRAALYDFAWNLGDAALARSTLLRLFNAGDVQAAADEFPTWICAAGKRDPGLVNRRRMERAVFLGLTTP